MTYSFNTLNSTRAANAQARSGWRRFADEILLVVGLLALVFWIVSMATYSATDVAWSTSGSGGTLVNRAGWLGAWLADASYFALGFSVWWCLAAGVRVWLSNLARWLRSRELILPKQEVAPSLPARYLPGRLAFWLGLLLLLAASTTLEWTRFYSLEARLPGTRRRHRRLLFRTVERQVAWVFGVWLVGDCGRSFGRLDGVSIFLGAGG